MGPPRRRLAPPGLAALIWAAINAAAPGASPGARAQSLPAGAPAAPQEITVIAPTPVPGAAVNADTVPLTLYTLKSGDLARSGSASAVDALESQIGAVNVNDDLDDPFQPDILFRGFEASPVLGTPEGLAVYQNGVRVNEAFGDSLNWDLVPDIAVNRISVLSSSPVYGLNALGGAVVIDMKTGFDTTGAEAEFSGGAWGQENLQGQVGWRSGSLGLYLAGRLLQESGWRAFSPDALRQVYLAASRHTPGLTLDLSLSLADNALSGESATPVQELQVSRSLVFTSPQRETNRLVFTTLNANAPLDRNSSLQADVYYRNFHQSVLNGNTTDYTPCGGSHEGDLCQADGETPLVTAAGGVIPDLSLGGARPIGERDAEAIHSVGVGGSLQGALTASLFGRDDHLTLGAAVDESSTAFGSGVEVGPVDGALQVQASGYVVDTAEETPFTATPVSLQAAEREYGLFATDTLDLTRGLSVTASGRYNSEELRLSDQRGQALSGKAAYRRLNPSLGLAQRLAQRTTLYVGYAEANRAPTPSEVECSNPLRPCLLPSSLSSDPPTLRQVVSHTLEAGLRGTAEGPGGLGGTITWNAAAFRTDVDDDIYGAATSLSAGYFENIGATRRQGAEANLAYRNGRVSIFSSYSHVDATFRSSFLLNAPQNPGADLAGDILVRDGDRLPGIPADRLKLGADLDVTPLWRVGMGMVLEGPRYFRGDESNQMKPLAGFAVLSLHSRYALTRRLEVFVNLVNALDARYATYGLLGDPTGVGAPGVPSGAAAGGPAVDDRFESPAAPLSAFAGARLRF